MKTLQNNFTTPKQSRRLLELGVPADSADMAAYTFFEPYNYKILKHPYSIFIRDYVPYDLVKFYTPCWSVGRLIEIYDVVGENAGQCISCNSGVSRIELLVQIFEENASLLDFSKLEELL